MRDQVNDDQAALPAFLFGYSGGARMTWRAACDAEIAPLFNAMVMASGLLASEFARPLTNAAGVCKGWCQSHIGGPYDTCTWKNCNGCGGCPLSTCAVDTLPPLVVLHGTADGTTNVNYADEAVEWVKKAKGLGTPTTTVNAVSASYTGNTYNANKTEYGSTCNGEYAEYSCSPNWSMTYYRIKGYEHWAPSAGFVNIVFGLPIVPGRTTYSGTTGARRSPPSRV